MINLVVSAVLGYLLGSLTLGIIVPRLMGTSQDIRKEGSGNVGATNVLRTQGKLQGGLVLLGDLLKGSIAAGLGLYLAGVEGGAIAGVCALLGHCFPLFFKLKGGKAVATCAGIIFVLIPQSMLIVAPVFLIVIVISRMVSLGSILAALALALSLALLRPAMPVVLFGLFGSLLVICRHHGNIRRILAGTESKLKWKKE